jgi:hypothetical protein
VFVSGHLPADTLAAIPEGEIAVQETAHGDTCVRLIGRDAEQVIAAAARVALSAAARLAGDPEPWFLDSTYLSGNHWFSPTPET